MHGWRVVHYGLGVDVNVDWTVSRANTETKQAANEETARHRRPDIGGCATCQSDNGADKELMRIYVQWRNVIETCSESASYLDTYALGRNYAIGAQPSLSSRAISRIIGVERLVWKP